MIPFESFGAMLVWCRTHATAMVFVSFIDEDMKHEGVFNPWKSAFVGHGSWPRRPN